MADSPAPFTGVTVDNSHPGNNAVFENLNFKPQENVLNKFDQVAYHIKFSVLADVQDVNKEVVIAESGTTELNIQSLECDAYVGPDISTKNTSVTKMTLTILEYYGYNIMDRIVEAATVLEVRNMQKTPFKLEVCFTGRDPVTGKAMSNVLGSSVWGWKVLISRMHTRVTESGCTHTLDLYPIGDQAGTDDYMRVPNSYRAGGQTCGDILKDLCGQLTNDINQKYGGSIKMVDYRVAGINYPASAQSPVANPLDHIVTNQDIFNSTRNPDQASISTGIPINELVDMLYSNSETAVKLANSVGTSTPASASTPTKNHSTMHRLEKVVQYGRYIDLYEDYEKVITFIIVPYDTVRVISNFNQYQNVHDPDATADKLQHVNSFGGMKKEYDYIFTGENTEVLKFDIELAFDYYVAVEIMLGTMSYSTATQAQAYNQFAQERVDSNNFMSYQTQLQQLQNDAAKLDKQNKDSANLGADAKKNLQDAIDKNKKDTIEAQKNVDSLKGKVAASTLRAEQRDDSRVAKAKIDLKNRNKTTYADDENFAGAIDALQKLPVTLRQQPGISSTVDGAVESHYDTRRAIYAGLMDQMYGNMDSNLCTVTIDIRGDPYWLGKPGYRDLFANGMAVLGTEQTVYDIKIPQQQESDKDWANFNIGENVMVLRYKMPTGFDEKTNKAIIKENDSYTGFYSINQVTHKFSEGKFTQTIKGFRVPGADVSKVLKQNQISNSPVQQSNSTNRPVSNATQATSSASNNTQQPRTSNVSTVSNNNRGLPSNTSNQNNPTPAPANNTNTNRRLMKNNDARLTDINLNNKYNV